MSDLVLALRQGSGYIEFDSGSNPQLNAAGVGFHLTGPVAELAFPPIEYVSRKVFDTPGEVVQSAHVALRQLTVPMAVRAPNLSTLGAWLGGVVRFLQLGTAEVLFRVTRPAFSDFATSGVGLPTGLIERELVCRYAGGLEGEFTTKDWGEAWIECALVLNAYDPYYRDIVDTNVSLGSTEAPAFFPFARNGDTDFGPYLGADAVFSGFTVNNDGDGIAWPIWVIHGPGADIELVNESTGETLALTREAHLAGYPSHLTLAEGDVLVIDTRPGVKTVTGDVAAIGSDVNLFPYVEPSSSLWGFAPHAVNTVSVTVAGSTVTTSVELAYRRRWLLPF